MSLFRNPASDFSTAPFLVETGEVNLKVSGIKAKVVDKNDGSQAGIIQVMLRVADGEFAGKPVQPIDCWYDDDGKNNTVMRIVLAALGVRPGTEDADAQFRAQFPDIDLSIDESTLKLAAGWNQVVGSVITCSAKKAWNAKREQNENKFSNFRPFGS